jgi:flagellar basal body-associated protein FliL
MLIYMLTLEPRRRGKFRVPKSVVRALVSVVVLLVLIAGAGIGYVWYMGQHPAKLPQQQETVAAAKKADLKPIKPAPNAKESASIQSLTSPVAPGDNAMVTIHTLPDSVCVISVVYDKTASTD